MVTRWGIAGFGWVARDYMAPAILASGGRVVAVADPSEHAQESARRLGAEVFDDLGAMTASLDIDALYVATPNHLHRPVFDQAVRAGLPTLCEKPLAGTLADAAAMVESATGLRAPCGTAFDQRHHPAHRTLKEHLRAGAIGTPTAVRIVYGCWVGPDWSDRNWRADPEAAGGGAAIDLALHGLDLTQYLLDDELALLTMVVQKHVHAYPVEDGAMLVGRFGGGVLLSLHVSYNCPEALPRRRLEVVGTSGSISAIDTMGQTRGGRLIRHCGATGRSIDIEFDSSRCPFLGQVEAFAAAVRGEPHDYDLSRDLRLMRLFDRSYQEARAWL
jgi:1,5-anhydro-D-fructose reductase (1,5-anhydro-D-mannitol-forming)